MPLQAIIVNTIFDLLLVVENGASIEEIKVNFKTKNSWESWGNPPHAWFSLGKLTTYLVLPFVSPFGGSHYSVAYCVC